MRTAETERRAYVEAFHRSGLRLIDFCRKRGLNPKTFYTWRTRYARHGVLTGSGLREPTFLPLRVTNGETFRDGIAKPPRILTFKTQKFCLEVALDARHNEAELKLIVQTLQEVL